MSLALGLAMVAGTGPSAQAATGSVYYVNSTAMTGGTCVADTDNLTTSVCTLTAAIAAANGDPGSTVQAASGFTGTIVPATGNATAVSMESAANGPTMNRVFWQITAPMTLNLAGLSIAMSQDNYALFYVNASNVTITNDNKAGYPLMAGGAVIVIGAKAASVTVDKLTNLTTNWDTNRFMDIVGGASDITISGSNISGNYEAAIGIVSPPSGTGTSNGITITGNTFGRSVAQGNGSSSAPCWADGIQTLTSSALTVNNLVITDNTFQNISVDNYSSREGSAINLSTTHNSNNLSAPNVVITGNTFKNIETFWSNDNTAAVMLPALTVFTGATVSGNTFDNSALATSLNSGPAIYWKGPNGGSGNTIASNLTISDNSIIGFGMAGGAINLWTAGIVTVRNNTFGAATNANRTGGQVSSAEEGLGRRNQMVGLYDTTSNQGLAPWYPQATAAGTVSSPSITASLVNGVCQASFYVVPPASGAVPKPPVDIDLYHTAAVYAETFVKTYTANSAAFQVTVNVPASSIDPTTGAVTGGYRVQTQVPGANIGSAQAFESSPYSRLIQLNGNCANPGQLQLSADTTTKAGDAQTFTINRVGGTAGTLSVNVVLGAAGDTAVLGTNYTDPKATSANATADKCTWADGADTPCTVTIPTIRQVDGKTLTYTVSLAQAVSGLAVTTFTDATLIDQSKKSVTGTIVDPPMGDFAIAVTNSPVDAGTALVYQVTRTNGSAGAADLKVTLNASGDSAVAGTNYTDPAATCHWDDGNADPCTVAVPTLVVADGATRSLTATISGDTKTAAGDVSIVTPAATGQIVDPSAGVFSIAGPGAPVGSGLDAVFTVSRTGGSAGAVSVKVSTSDGTALAGTNYQATTFTCSWADGDVTPCLVSVPTMFTGTGSQFVFSASLSAPSGGNASVDPAGASAQATIADAASGYFTLSGPSGSVAAGAPLTFVVHRAGGTAGAVSVDFGTVDGTAKAGTNYQATTQTCSWADGQVTDCVVTVPTLVATDGQTLSLTGLLSNPVGPGTYLSSKDNSAPGSIIDPPASQFTVTGPGGPVTAGQPASFIIERTAGTVGAVSVGWATGDGTGVAGTNYVAASGTCSWADGQTAPCVVDVDTLEVGDSLTPTFTVTLSDPVGDHASIVAGQDTATATIQNPSAGTLAITGPAAPVPAGQPATFTVTRTDSTVGPLSVDWASQDGTGVQGTNYTKSSGTCTWAAGDATPCVVQVPTLPVNDGGTPGFAVILMNATNNATIATGSASATIQNPDAGVFAISGPAGLVGSGLDAVFTVNRTGGSAGAVAVKVSTSDGSALAGTNYQATTFMCAWVDGDVTPCSVPVPTMFTGTGSQFVFSGSLSAPSGGNASVDPAGASAQATITDAASGYFTLSGPSASVAAGVPLTFTVHRVGGTTGAVSVDFGTVDASAVAGTNYVTTTHTCSWADGDDADCLVSVNTLVATDGQTLSLTGLLSNPVGPGTYLSSQDNSAPGSIVDPAASQFTVTGPAGVVTAGQPASFTVERVAGTVGAVSVGWSTGDGTGVAGTNYVAASGTCAWADGNTDPCVVTVDTLVVGDSTTPTFTVVLSGPSGDHASIAAGQDTATATIQNPSAGHFAIAGPSADVAAGQPATFTVTRTGGSTGPVSVTVTTTDDTAVAGTNYQATTITCSWPDGDATPCSVPVPTIFTGVGGTTAFTASLSNPVGGDASVLTGSESAQASIVDRAAGYFTLTGPSSVTAAGQPVTFTVNRVGGTAGAVSVDFATANDTAAAGTNYTDVQTTCKWSDGDQQPCVIEVPTTSVNDGKLLALTAKLTNPVGPGTSVTAPSDTAAAQIQDPQAGAFTVTREGGVITAGDPATFTIDRVGGTAGAVGVHWAAVSGTAIEGVNFAAASGDCNWADGSATPCAVSVPTNAVVDGKSVTFTMELSDPAGGNASIATGSATASIQDPAPSTFTITGPTGPVKAGEDAVFVVNRVGGTYGAVSVSVTFTDGSAVAGVNYSGLTLTCSWADGSNEPCYLRVPTYAQKDGKVVSFTATLSDATGAGAYIVDESARSTTAVQILDPKRPAIDTGGTLVAGNMMVPAAVGLALVAASLLVLGWRRRRQARQTPLADD